MSTSGVASQYWRTNLRYLALLLSIWFLVSFGCSILWVDALDRIEVGGFKLGFWFAQQGSIYVFVALIAVYVFLMNRLDRRMGYRDDGPGGSSSADAASPDEAA